VGDGVDLVKTAVTSLQQIYDAINGVSDTVGQIASASSEQATSLDELNQAVMEMDSMTQQNASMAQQSRTVAQIMQEKSAELSDMVGFFKIEEQDVERFARKPANKSRPAPEPVKTPAIAKKPLAKSGKGGRANTATAKHSDNDADWQEF
jgi:methyl-accepting chemotaxis protein